MRYLLLLVILLSFPLQSFAARISMTIGSDTIQSLPTNTPMLLTYNTDNDPSIDHITIAFNGTILTVKTFKKVLSRSIYTVPVLSPDSAGTVQFTVKEIRGDGGLGHLPYTQSFKVYVPFISPTAGVLDPTAAVPTPTVPKDTAKVSPINVTVNNTVNNSVVIQNGTTGILVRKSATTQKLQDHTYLNILGRQFKATR